MPNPSMQIVEVEKTEVLVKLLASGRHIWLPKAMLKEYGVPAKSVKIGAKL